jgi:hypothetical protein
MNKTFKDCTNEDSIVRLKFACGCRLEKKDEQIFLILPLRPGPCTGERRRFLGYIKGTTLWIHRTGRDYLRVKQCYGVNVHLLQSAAVLGFDRIRCETPLRGGYLPPLPNLLVRTPFTYDRAGFETQVGFTLNEIR